MGYIVINENGLYVLLNKDDNAIRIEFTPWVACKWMQQLNWEHFLMVEYWHVPLDNLRGGIFKEFFLFASLFR